MSIDQKDAQVQFQFSKMKKEPKRSEKILIAQVLAKMYQKEDEEYSDGILKRIYRFISDSQDRDDKCIGLIALAEVGLKMQGSARAAFVNKFHSPVFKLFQVNQQEILIQQIQKAYKVILQLGGNQNDATIESNFFSCISILQGNSKDVKKMGAYSALMVILQFSPYLAFKKLLQKRSNQGCDNLQILMNSSRVKNLKVRQSFIKFLNQYISYVGEKKDNPFKVVTLERFLTQIDQKDISQESTHLTLQILCVCLNHLRNVMDFQLMQEKTNYVLQKIKSLTKSQVIQRSLIQLSSLIIDRNFKNQTLHIVLNFLRSIPRQNKYLAQDAINLIIGNITEKLSENSGILKSLVHQINKYVESRIGQKPNQIDDHLVASKITTILILLKDKSVLNQVFTKKELDQIATNSILLNINQKIIKLIAEISKKNLFQLGSILEKKLILVIFKSLTGSTKHLATAQDISIKSFIEKLEKLNVLQSEQNKIKALESLSFFKFRQQFQTFVAKFVKEKVLKRYLEQSSNRMRAAAAEAAFNLYSKKNSGLAQNQLKQILYKLLRIGLTDDDQMVREKVFLTLKDKIIKYQNFQNYVVEPEILTHIFQAVQDPNETIRFTCLKVLTVIHQKKPSALLIIFLKKLTNNIIMHFSTNFKYNYGKENLIKSLSIIIENAPTIVENHVELLLQSLLEHLSDRKNYQGLQLSFFKTFQVLIQHHSAKTIPYLTQICIHIVQALNDKLNSKKRNQSLSLLLSMIKKCNYVILPYLEVPGLAESLTYLLRSELSKESKIDLLRVIGGFGALDKHKHSVFTNLIQNLNQEEKISSLSSKGYQFKFLWNRKNLVAEKINLERGSNEIKQYYNEISLLLNNEQNQDKLKKNTGKKLTNKLSDNVIQNKGFFSAEIEKEQPDPFNFNIVIILNLFQIMNDGFSTEKSQLTYDVIFRIFQILGKDLEKDLHIIIPLLAQSQFNVMKLIISIVKDCDITPYLEQIINYTLKSTDPDLITQCLQIVTYRYRSHLRSKLDAIIGKLYSLIQDRSENHKLQVKIVVVLRNLSSMIQPFLSQIITILFEKFFVNVSQVTNAILDFLMSIANFCSSLPQYFAKISYSFCQILKFCHRGHTQCKPCCRVKIGNCVVIFLISYGESFMIFLPEIHKAIIRCNQIHETYVKAIHYMENCYYGNLRDQFGAEELDKLVPQIKSPYLNLYQIPKSIRKIQGIQELIHEFDCNGKKFNDSDWIQWIRKTSILLLRKSPNVLLRTCADLGEQYPGLALQFYNISFYFLWQILLDTQKKQLLDNLKSILTYYPKPYILIRKVILNLVQFMNRKRHPLQISNMLLAQSAKESSSYAKSLYYKELQFEENPEQEIYDLIQIYMLLGQQQNAAGLLKIAQNLGIQCKVQWYEKLGQFQQGYKIYADRERLNFDHFTVQMKAKKLKCLSYVNEQSFMDQLEQFKESFGYKSDLSLLACKSYAELGNWEQVQKWEIHIPEEESVDKNIFRSLIHIHKNYFEQSIDFISECRQKIYNQLSDIIVFSTSSEAFEKILKIQKLFQLQEIMQLKKFKRQVQDYQLKYPEKQERQMQLNQQYSSRLEKIKEVWSDRLLGSPKNQAIWSRFFYTRNLLFSFMQYFQFFYEYCEICIDSGKVDKCEKILHSFKKQIQASRPLYDKKIQFLEALEIKINFAQKLIKTEEQIFLIVKFIEQSRDLPNQKRSQILFDCANVLIEGQSYNKQMVLELLQKSSSIYVSQKKLEVLGNMYLKISETSSEMKIQYIKQAIRVFLKLLKISQVDNQYHLQNCLKVLGILFRFSQIQQISEEFRTHFREVPLHVWITVTPQMIAHLHQSTSHQELTSIIKEILIHIGETHPQSILYSLIFSARSKISERTKPAMEILNKIKEKNLILADEIWMISQQLSNAAIKLKEYWYDGIQTAWSVYNQSKSTAEVLSLLKQIKAEVQCRKKTNSQIAFHNQFSQEIHEGFQWIQRFEISGNPIFLSQAFEMFIGVYRKVKQSFQNLKKVYLKNVAPNLLSNHRYISCVPGTYNVRAKNVKIDSFYNELSVLQSKQRPRKLKVFGDNDKEYHFLLKGREDVRLDERVMQFLGLVNKLLERQNQTIKKDLKITRYDVIPLTVNAGLIGWVEGCDTLNELIKQFRTSNKLRVYLERQCYQKICPEYAYLPVINKLQVFQTVLDSGQGKDLLRIFWYNSENSEQWVERRKNYTTSLATMSIVGYILGLGDRHPSNIMIEKKSGKVVHIDFGDCFEVASLREKFPEKVPFRLTRMLQNAMGSAGIHGLYQQTCQDVMKVLRDNRDSLLAVVQTFVHDPILSWRITTGKKPDQKQPNLDSNKKPGTQMIGSIMQGLQEAIVEVHKQDHQRQEEQLRTPSVKEKYTRTNQSQKINEKAIYALIRIKKKLNGIQWGDRQLSINQHVSRLIRQAISHENICQSWPGWCPYW